MASLRFSLALSTLFGMIAVVPLRAQDSLVIATPSCVSSWDCDNNIRPPLGFVIDTVTDGGRYITLEDGTRWEVQLDSRATVGAWQRNDFVDVRRIAAPNGDFEWLFTKGDAREWRAAVRFAGRAQR